MADELSLGWNPVACDGVGICAHLAPESIELDRWGYPIVTDRELSGVAARRARAAIAACPHKALFAR